MHRVKHQIQYASIEKVKWILWQTIYNSNYTQNCSKLLQWKMYKYKLEFAICTKNKGLLKLYSKEKTNFLLIKLLFIKVKRLININVSLGANLEGQGW